MTDTTSNCQRWNAEWDERLAELLCDAVSRPKKIGELGQTVTGPKWAEISRQMVRAFPSILAKLSVPKLKQHKKVMHKRYVLWQQIHTELNGLASWSMEEGRFIGASVEQQGRVVASLVRQNKAREAIIREYFTTSNYRYVTMFRHVHEVSDAGGEIQKRVLPCHEGDKTQKRVLPCHKGDETQKRVLPGREDSQGGVLLVSPRVPLDKPLTLLSPPSTDSPTPGKKQLHRAPVAATPTKHRPTLCEPTPESVSREDLPVTERLRNLRFLSEQPRTPMFPSNQPLNPKFPSNQPLNLPLSPPQPPLERFAGGERQTQRAEEARAMASFTHQYLTSTISEKQFLYLIDVYGKRDYHTWLLVNSDPHTAHTVMARLTGR